jgi:3-deoxy-D-manno-octulosonate 8-phosphate phosphatase KdsC-like HAD superfamily phosphatase
MPRQTSCSHLSKIRDVQPNTPEGCEECLAIGDDWVHLRLCMSCGHVGCCNDSKNKHATKHFIASHPPIIRSFEPGESWMFCFPDDLFME